MRLLLTIVLILLFLCEFVFFSRAATLIRSNNLARRLFFVRQLHETSISFGSSDYISVHCLSFRASKGSDVH